MFAELQILSIVIDLTVLGGVREDRHRVCVSLLCE